MVIITIIIILWQKFFEKLTMFQKWKHSFSLLVAMGHWKQITFLSVYLKTLSFVICVFWKVCGLFVLNIYVLLVGLYMCISVCHVDFVSNVAFNYITFTWMVKRSIFLCFREIISSLEHVECGSTSVSMEMCWFFKRARWMFIITDGCFLSFFSLFW